MSGDEETKSDGGTSGTKKLVAQAHMSFVKPLSPYNEKRGGFFNMSGSNSPIGSFRSGSGSADGMANLMNDVNMKEED